MMQQAGRIERAGNQARSALGLVLIAVLNLAFQPCAMAMDMDTDHGCPHCPTEARHGNHDNKPKLDDIADCDYVNIYNHDGRSTESQGKDLSPDLNAPIAGEFSVAESALPQSEFRFGTSAARHPGDPPLNILYCVFLK